jgi:hypothetical protein
MCLLPKRECTNYIRSRIHILKLEALKYGDYVLGKETYWQNSTGERLGREFGNEKPGRGSMPHTLNLCFKSAGLN